MNAQITVTLEDGSSETRAVDVDHETCGEVFQDIFENTESIYEPSIPETSESEESNEED